MRSLSFRSLSLIQPSKNSARAVLFAPKRCSFLSSRAANFERREVRVGGSGNVNIECVLFDVLRWNLANHQASVYRALETRTTQVPSVLVHIPSGPPLVPISGNPRNHDSILKSLAEQLPTTTLVAINYRLSPAYVGSKLPTSETHFRFPQPIHDVSESFAYVVEHLVPSLFTDQDWPQILLHGRHFGGALAAMLALTAPDEINAVAIENPILDWVMLDELTSKTGPDKSSKRKLSSATETLDFVDTRAAARQLMEMRTKLFPNPSHYFDPFASPTLFLRAPGRDTPRTHAEAVGLFHETTEQGGAQDDWIALADIDEYPDGDSKQPLDLHPASDTATESEADTIAEAEGSFGPYDDDLPPPNQPLSHDSSASALSSPPTSPSSNKSDVATESQTASDSQPRAIRRRKVLRRWPPVHRSEDVSLPYFNVLVSGRPMDDRSNSSDTDNLNSAMQEILRMQGVEFAELLKRACFFGRERSVADERVEFTEIQPGDSVGPSQVAMEWLRKKIDEAS